MNFVYKEYHLKFKKTDNPVALLKSTNIHEEYTMLKKYLDV